MTITWHYYNLTNAQLWFWVWLARVSQPLLAIVSHIVIVCVLCISNWLSVRNRQCLYKQDPTSHTKSCTSIYSVVIPIHLKREMAFKCLQVERYRLKYIYLLIKLQ